MLLSGHTILVPRGLAPYKNERKCIVFYIKAIFLFSLTSVSYQMIFDYSCSCCVDRNRPKELEFNTFQSQVSLATHDVLEKLVSTRLAMKKKEES